MYVILKNKKEPDYIGTQILYQHFFFKNKQVFQNACRKMNMGCSQRYTYRVLQTIQMKLILLCVWAEPAILGSTKTASKFKYEI